MSNQPLPAVPYLKIPEDGSPYLEGLKCGQCGSTFLGDRNVCSKCGARDQMSPVTLPNSGKLLFVFYRLPIVPGHRSPLHQCDCGSR
jgi:uncharacterized OB-fold protein